MRALRARNDLLLGTVLVLAACGGGDEGPAPPQPAVAPPAQQEMTVDPAPEPVQDPAAGVEQEVPRAEPGPGVDRAEPPRAPVAPPLTPEMQARRDEARRLRESAGPGPAIELLEATERELGANGVLRLDRARYLLDLGVWADTSEEIDAVMTRACAALDEADALAADLPGSAALRARLMARRDDEESARALLLAHLERFPGDPTARLVLGEMHFDAKEWGPADTQLTLAAELDPDSGRARYLATVAKQWLTVRGDAAYTRDALRRGFREAALLLPDEDDALRMLIGLYPRGSSRAVEALQEVIADNPAAVHARWRLGDLLLRSEHDDPQAALGHLAEADRLRPDDPQILVTLAAAHAALGDAAAAVRTYVRVLDVDPGHAAPRVSNALDALLHPGDPAHPVPRDLRERACDALVVANPHDGRFGNNAGFWFREEARDYETSLRYYLAATRASPADQDYLTDTGYLYLQHLRDWKERCEPLFLAARRLVEEEGHAPTRGYWDALEHLCRYYFEVGRYNDVVLCADLRASPDAKLGDRPYPSSAAASFRAKARAKLE